MGLKEDIGNRIKEIRGSMSQAAFSKELNVTQSTIARYEKGSRSPDAEFLLLIKKYYDINPNWLISGEEPKFIQNGIIADEAKPISETKDVIVIEHSDLVKEFEDQIRAIKINKNILKIERKNKRAFRDLDIYIEGVAQGLDYVDMPQEQETDQSNPDDRPDQEKTS